MAAMLMSEMLMELLCFRRQKFDYDDAWRRTFFAHETIEVSLLNEGCFI